MTEKTDMMGLTQTDRMNAYRATKECFNLRARQRNLLDSCATYSQIMYFAKNEAWDHVEFFLKQEGIIA